MNSIESTYICLAAPIIVAILCLKGKGKQTMLFLLIGMTGCLLSSYINTFLRDVYGVDSVITSIEIAPVVEECMKLVPFVFYLVVFNPRKERFFGDILSIAIGFATFENVCYMLGDDSASILHLLIRGFGTGAMHVLCGTLIAIGLLQVWDSLYLRMLGVTGLLCIAIIYHAIYNLLVTSGGAVSVIGYLIPLLSVIPVLFLKPARVFMVDFDENAMNTETE